MARFDKFDAARKKSTAQTNGHSTKMNGESSASPATVVSGSVAGKRKHGAEAEDDEEFSDIQGTPAPKKKPKVDYDSDAAYAAKLQAQENRRIRSTRGGGSKPTHVKKKKAPKKKTSAKVRAEDDSGLDGSSSEVKERKVNRSGGFHVRRASYYLPFIKLTMS